MTGKAGRGKLVLGVLGVLAGALVAFLALSSGGNMTCALTNEGVEIRHPGGCFSKPWTW